MITLLKSAWASGFCVSATRHDKLHPRIGSVMLLGCGLALVLTVAGLGATLENDICTGALGLREGEPYRLNTMEATSERDPLPTCVTSFGKGVWFTVQPERNGWMTVSTCDSGFDTVLQVYRGGCDELMAVEGACNDDNGPACTGSWASVRFLAEPEWVYYILVGGYGSAGGDLTIEASLQTGVDLAVEASAQPDPAEACGLVTYTLTVRNLGQDEAQGISVQNVLPDGVEFISAQLAGGSCREENGVVSCSLEALAPAGRVEGQITIRTLATGVLNNLTSVATEQEDLNPENNLFELVTLVEDTTSPVIQCPEDIVVQTCDSSVAVSFSVMATDCTPGVRVLCSPPSGSIFPVGQTIVTCEATDEAGNSAQCQFAVQVEQGGVEPAVTISTGTLNEEPAVAFDPARNRWLVVWKEGISLYPGAGRVRCRLVDADGSIASSIADVSGLLANLSSVRVAYDPVGDEFLVVWASAQDPIEGDPTLRIRARRVSAGGSPVGTAALEVSAPDGQGEAHPDVTAGRVSVDGGAWQSYWMVVWEDTRTANRLIQGQAVFADITAGPSQLRRSDYLLTLDATLLPGQHQSFHPRLSRQSEVTAQLIPPSTMVEATRHQAVFEVQEGSGVNMLSDIWSARLDYQAVSGLAQLTLTSDRLENEAEPEIAWNLGDGRSLLVFRRGSEVRGQWLQTLASSPWFNLVADDFLLGSGDEHAFVAVASDGSFLGVNHLAAGLEGNRVAGHHLFPWFAYLNDTDQPDLAMNTVSGTEALLVYRSGAYEGATEVQCRVVCGLLPLFNQAPVANAGTNQSVIEGTTFALDGTGSTDPDGDPLVYRWTQTSGVAAGFLGSTNVAAPLLQAPLLEPGQAETRLGFLLEVDDLRSPTVYPSSDTVRIVVVPGEDPNPPVADAGTDQVVDEDAFVQLNGCQSHDPDGEPITVTWVFEGYSPATNLPPPVLQPSVTDCAAYYFTPRFSRLGGLDMHFRLDVTSSRGGLDSDTVTIHVNDSVNENPVADAGPAFSATEHVLFYLNGSGSWDPNGDALTYHWELASTLDWRQGVSEEVTISPETSTSPVASVQASVFSSRELDFLLTVTDGRGGSASDLVKVTVQALPMAVTGASPMNGSPGSVITITGNDLISVTNVTFNGYGGSIKPLSDSQLQVRVPNGGRVRRAGGAFQSLKGGLFDVWEYPELTTGPLVVSGPGYTWTSPTNFVVSHVELANVVLSQGVPLYDLVREKDTLLQVQVRTKEGAPAPNAGLSNAVCYVTPGTNDYFEVKAASPPIRAVPRNVQVAQMSEALNFFLPANKMTEGHYEFQVSVYHNGLEVLYLESITPSVSFYDSLSPRILILPIVPFSGGTVDPTFDWNVYWSKCQSAVVEFKRIYPWPDVDFVVSPTAYRMPQLLGDDGKVHLEAFSISGDFLFKVLPAVVKLQEFYEEWNHSHPQQLAMFAVGAIADELNPPNASTTGFGVPTRNMMARMVKYALTEEIPYIGPIIDILNDAVKKVVCFFTLWTLCPDPIETAVKAFFGVLDVFGVEIGGHTAFVIMHNNGGSVMAHEIGHNLGLIDPYAYNSDSDNLSHSKYDEGAAALYLVDSPGVSPPIFDVLPPGKMYLGREGNSSDRPKALMSYAKNRVHGNVFHELSDYNKMIAAMQPWLDYLNKASDGLEVPREGRPSPMSASANLYMVGFINLTNGQATILRSSLISPDTGTTPVLEESPLQLVFLDAGGVVLQSVPVPYTFFFHTTPPEDVDHLIVTHALCKIVQPVPTGWAEVQLHWYGEPGWSRSLSAHPPEVEVLAPIGGQILAPDEELAIQWLATDADGDPLVASVFYSDDGGLSFSPIEMGVTESEVHWVSRLAPGSDQAVIKVEVTDGFHTAAAFTAPFVVSPKPPQVVILSPSNGARVAQSATVAFSGQAYDLTEGVVRDEAAYEWASSVTGLLGQGRTLAIDDLPVGAHLISLTVIVGDREGSASVEIEILSDRDGDGLADEIEEAIITLDPDNPEDAYLDEDHDGLTHSVEVLRYGTNPYEPDSDGDGIPDGEEVAAGQNPISADTDGDGVPDFVDNCPRVANPEQEDRDGDGVGDACDVEVGWLQITSLGWVTEQELRIGFQPGVDVPADRCLLEWTAELPGGWEPVPEAQLHRAEPSEIFAYLVPLPEPIRHRFFRIRLLE